MSAMSRGRSGARPLSIGVVGAGRVGAVLGAALNAAGHHVVAAAAVSAASRDRARRLLPEAAILPADDVARAAGDLLLLAVPDDALGSVVAGLAATGALRPGQMVAHTSGAHGLAVLGEFAYGCLKDKDDDNDLASTDVLPNPYHERVTLVRDFLKTPNLENTLTDSHFAKRDRMGRTLGFLARLVQDGWSKAPREVAIDEKSAVLVEPNGTSMVVGTGRGAYLIAIFAR